jgi:hypothetical protein
LIVFGLLSLVATLALYVALVFVPAMIARQKGRSFGLWFVYSFFLWIIALVHSLLAKDKGAKPAAAADPATG